MPQHTEQEQIYCTHCRRLMLHQRHVKDTNHIFHLLMCVFTCGWWLVVWLLCALGSGSNPHFLCSKCGQPEALPEADDIVKEPASVDMRLIGLIVLLGCLGVAFFGASILLFINASSKPPPDTTTAEPSYPPKPPTEEEVLVDSLEFLGESPDVAWYEIQENQVVIGFEEETPTIEPIIREAALRGNRALDYGFCAWAVPATPRDWTMNEDPYFVFVWARYGSVDEIQR